MLYFFYTILNKICWKIMKGITAKVLNISMVWATVERLQLLMVIRWNSKQNDRGISLYQFIRGLFKKYREFCIFSKRFYLFVNIFFSPLPCFKVASLYATVNIRNASANFILFLTRNFLQILWSIFLNR